MCTTLRPYRRSSYRLGRTILFFMATAAEENNGNDTSRGAPVSRDY